MSSYLKRFIPFILPYKKHVALNIVFSTLYALFSALSFVALVPMLDIMFNKEATKVYEKPLFPDDLSKMGDYAKTLLNYEITQVAGNNPIWALGMMIGLVITMFLLKNLFNYLAIFFVTFLRNGVLRDLRNKLYKKVTELPISYFSEQRKGDIISRISGDVNEVQSSFLSVLELIFREPLTIIFSIMAMLAISAKLTLFVFIFIPISGLIISKIGKSLKKQSTKVQEEQGRFLSLIEETVGGLRIIKAFNAEKIFNKRFQESTQRFHHFANSLMNRQNLASPVSEFLGILVIAILLWFGGSMVLIEKTLDGSEFIAFMGLAYNILTPAKAISRASYDLRRGNAAAERVMEILDYQSQIQEKPNAIDKPNFEHSMVLKNITFAYGEQNVLENFSLEIPKGKTVALVGQSGSGKSTIANLITRFYDVNQGQILLDGIDIKDLKIASLRRFMGIVAQDSILFNDTISNNLRIGKPDATQEEIIAAAKVANAYEFIQDLPQGFETNIGDAGNKLSGGQKQRLSIARAVLKNPPIMILDEATSALDTESERLVQNALENMMKNRTSIVIAHRLSTIQNADLIVVMQKGKIVEQGTHSQLLAKKGMYHKLVEMQSFGV
ncbi:ABC transporter ATP-binding protein [Capnocytophaga canimorsus]|uniref:ABC transporter ATP-binding protein n=1 Tax=Capnocytophaga canimorsus TaxID=28188 RepID=UPI000BB186A3|nr:ABC transporter ATP-binding protein [Capnocytophaga canimorsus]ATA76117.1 antibiotic ABC transporter ATP-binding protein [Capnocytophaga canimorsus]PJI80314.1 ATP-binding cassette, subfamily B, MsbA [Capnocytophaga canimorsus]STA71221.1 Lipid A export ATP-binding/permease protein MsbA [Capnocytophaga canimorsus]